MPMRGRARPSHSLLERSVVAHVNYGKEAWCPCHLSFRLDKTTDKDECPRQGTITLRLEQLVQFERLDRKVSVTLRLPLENLESVECKRGGAESIPSTIWGFLSRRHSFRQSPLLFTLILRMSAPGCVIVPTDATVPLTSRDDRSDIEAFRRLCEATELRVYIHAYDAAEVPEAAFELLSALVTKKEMLVSKPPDLRRMYKKRGARETTWEIFDIPELPPAYQQQPERSTSKRTRETSPASTPKRRAIDSSRSIEPKPAASVSNTDTDTDFSAHALSPLPASFSHVGVTAAPHKRTPTSASVDADHIHLVLRSMVQDALPNIVQAALSEILPTMLRTAVQDMLPRVLNNTICGLWPGRQQENASDTQPGTEQEGDKRHPLAAVMEPIIQEQLPTVVRKVIEDDGTYDDLISEAREQIEMAISEEKDDALDKIREERDACVRDVQDTGTIVREMLERADWSVDCDGHSQAIPTTVQSILSGGSPQSDLLRFTRTRVEGAPASAESVEDVAGITKIRVEGSPLAQSSSSTYDNTTEAETDIVCRYGQEGSHSPPPIHDPSLSTHLPGEMPSLGASTTGAQARASEHRQSSSGLIDKLSTMSAGNEESALGEEDRKEWQDLDLSPTQANTEIFSSHERVHLGPTQRVEATDVEERSVG